MERAKLKVVIADDEFRIGMLIKKLINWDKLNLECVKIVNNGEAALEAIEEESPDIVITDIQMPKIDGLELIAKASEEFKKIKFIVISGYKNFEYAHKALQYGVTSYLLKPINEEELNNVLEKIVSDCREKIAKEEEEEIHQKEIRTGKTIIKRNLLRNIVEKKISVSPSEIEERFNIVLDKPLFRAIDIKLDYWDFEKTNKRQDQITGDKITEIVEKCFYSDNIEKLIFPSESLHIFCLFNYTGEESKNILNTINNILIEIEDYLLGFEQYDVTIGIGNEKDQFENALDSINEACEAVNNRIQSGTGRLITAEKIKTNTISFIDAIINKYKEEYINSIHSYSTEEFKRVINNIFNETANTKGLDSARFYDLTKNLIDEFFVHIEEKNQDGEILNNYLLEIYRHCNTVAKLKEIFTVRLTGYLESCLESFELRSTKPVREAKKFIEENYSKKITLEEIAEIVELNPVYFSVLFKKETGLNFSTYLVGVKMEKAKKMLIETNDTIAAVADSLGYKDMRYFSKLFTKTVGVKPTVYRKLYS